ncbi:hypothetical protein B005_2973 [Nocardiopsis alba ATCC BAA-2165]|uniref:Uncharacterized protein n=1 Tax=Nocardiopsis alba (strain ATCC BAA-2165 / BE74) TaxID=1205910 RepID=J7KZG5_NOCAA|nr:hypothetical protein B005_2973 [Nocardiopsis alba ATCC BAA-2165]
MPRHLVGNPHHEGGFGRSTSPWGGESITRISLSQVIGVYRR